MNAPEDNNRGRSDEELPWGGAPAETADEMEVASSGWREPIEANPSPIPLTDEALTRLAREEGWDAAEIEAIRALVGRGSPSDILLPGAEELDEAIAALGAVPVAPQPVAGTAPSAAAEPSVESWEEAAARDDRRWAKAPSPDAAMNEAAMPETPITDEPISEARIFRAIASTAPPASRPPVARQAPTDPAWLRGRRGPAATAFRRLRRLISG